MTPSERLAAKQRDMKPDEVETILAALEKPKKAAKR